MPELPEVETTVRGISPHLIEHSIVDIKIRERRMRWPIEDDVFHLLRQTITSVSRRAKYIFIHCEKGTLILHLGMSGSLRICPKETPLKKHDHFVMTLLSGMEMRLHDPRRFGCVLWHEGNTKTHRLIKNLGPEPLSKQFTVDHLTQSCKGKKTSIKQHIMNNKVVVGVGNIYACEALFHSSITPTQHAGKIGEAKLSKLTAEIKKVLRDAITQGGTTLRDFLREDGQPGYFKQRLHVYDREGEPCRTCEHYIQKVIISGRSTFYCPHCQS